MKPREWYLDTDDMTAELRDVVEHSEEGPRSEYQVLVREVLPATECEADALSETLLALENYDNVFAGFEPDDKASRFEMRRAVILAREVLAKHKALLAKAKGRAE